MPPAKFKTARVQTAAEFRRNALERLRNRFNLDNENGEWEPESEPVITPMLKSVEGGMDHCITALRAHEDEDAQAFLEMWDRCTATDRKYLRIEDIAHASGVGSLRLVEVCQTALFLYGDRQTQMILSSSMAKVMRATVKAATDEVPITAYDMELRANRVVGKTNGDVRAMEILLKSRGILPTPKGTQINLGVGVNLGDRESKQSESGHTWKYPEDRLKEIVAVTNPKQLEAGRVSTDTPIHFDHNRPMVFER
jgi:hypothetical protein